MLVKSLKIQTHPFLIFASFLMLYILSGCDTGLFDEVECQSNQDCEQGSACVVNPYVTDEDGTPIGECAVLAQCSCDYDHEVCVEQEIEMPICKMLYTNRIAGEFCHTSSVCQSGICAPDVMNSFDEDPSFICVEASMECLDECTGQQTCVSSEYSESGDEPMCLDQRP